MTKTCAKCGGSYADGSKCQPCMRLYHANYYLANKEKNKEPNKVYRANNLERKKEYDAKRRSENIEHIKIKQSAYYADNHKCIREKQKVYREKNKEKLNAYSSEWHLKNKKHVRDYKLKNKEIIASHSSAYRAINKEKISLRNAKWRSLNPGKVKAQSNRWKSENPSANRIHKQNRRSRKIENGGVLSKGLTEKLFKLQRGKCPCCGEPLGDDYHLDHKMPLALGGANEDWNMQLLRAICNMQKHAKHPIDFMQSKGFLL